MLVVHHERDVPVQFPLELRARLIPNVRRVALLARDDQVRRAVQAVPRALAPEKGRVRREGEVLGEIELNRWLHGNQVASGKPFRIAEVGSFLVQRIECPQPTVAWILITAKSNRPKPKPGAEQDRIQTIASLC